MCGLDCGYSKIGGETAFADALQSALLPKKSLKLASGYFLDIARRKFVRFVHAVAAIVKGLRQPPVDKLGRSRRIGALLHLGLHLGLHLTLHLALLHILALHLPLHNLALLLLMLYSLFGHFFFAAVGNKGDQAYKHHDAHKHEHFFLVVVVIVGCLGHAIALLFKVQSKKIGYVSAYFSKIRSGSAFG